jgi:AcrR family transcriptional regulator
MPARPQRSKPTREEKKAATREALLDAAARVFARQGYVAASVDDVAWEAGVTKGAVYSNFASKEALFAAVMERQLDHLLLAIPDRVDPMAPLDEQTARAGEQFMAALNQDREIFLLGLEYTLYAARHPDGGDHAMLERHRRVKATVGQAIERLSGDADMGLVGPVLPIDQVVVAFQALGNGIALERLNDPAAVPDDLYGNMLAIFARGLEAIAEDRAFGDVGARQRRRRAKPR